MTRFQVLGTLVALLLSNFVTYLIVRDGFTQPNFTLDTPDNAVRGFYATKKALTDYSFHTQREKLKPLVSPDYESSTRNEEVKITIEDVDEQSASRAEVFVVETSRFGEQDVRLRKRFIMAGDGASWRIAKSASECSCVDKTKGVCRGCEGSGKCSICDGTGNIRFYGPCTLCNSGICSACKGSGKCSNCPGDGWWNDH